MLRQNKKVIASWPHSIRDRISRFLRIPGRATTAVPAEDARDSDTERPPPLPRVVVFSDTDNDLDSVNATLRFCGILNQEGDVTENLEGMTIFHTGDLIAKKKPDLSVVKYWQLLQRDALRKGCRVRLIAGNHEQEIWRRMHAGENYGMDAGQVQKLNHFIESLDLFYVAGTVLFIHGYPTLEFLKALAHFHEVTGKDLNSFNKDHYKKSFKSVRAMQQYAYVRESRKANHLLYDLKDARDYYKKKGRLVGAILDQLKIATVVHGHKPQRSGTQADFEFGKWIPNIRMIGNDTNVSQRGIGATVIRETSTGTFDIVFVNSKTASDELRRKVQETLGKPFGSNTSELFGETHSSPANGIHDA